MSAGFEPTGVVMGATAMQLYAPSCGVPGYGAEPLIFPTYERALRDAWRTAIDRLEAEASRAGAHGVVGVAVKAPHPDTFPASAVRQFQLVGTGVRVRHEPPLRKPFLSMLSMEDSLKLLLRGWAPSGIAVGVSAVHVHGWAASPVRQRVVTKNVEMAAPTAGMALARDRAEHEARMALVASRAEGMIAAELGVTRSEQPCSGGSGILIEGIFLGTGVVRFRNPAVSISAVRNLSPAGAT